MHTTITREDILEVLHTNIGKVVEDAPDLSTISQTQSLKDDLGADSLEIVEVVSRSMKDLRIKVPRTELAKATNIGELADIFERFVGA